MITLSEAWKTEMDRAGVAPIWLVAIHCRDYSIAPYADHVFRFVSGDRAYSTSGNGGGTPEQVQNSVETITNLSAELDPLTRALSINDTTITFVDDLAFREILDGFYIAGNKIELFIGSHGLASLSDFQKVGTVYVQELEVGPGLIGLQCNGAGRIFEDKEIVGEWYGYHPLEMIDMCMQSAGLGDDVYDRTTLDATALTSKSTWVLTRANSPRPHSRWKGPRTGITEPTKVKDLVDELTGLMGGTFAPDLAGVFKFSEYNTNAAIVATWGEDEIDELEQTTTWANMINDFRVSLSNSPERFRNDDHYNQEIFEMGYADTNSQRFFGAAGVPLVRNQTTASPWLSGFGTVSTAKNAAGVRQNWLDPAYINTGDFVWISGGHQNGMCGTYVPGQHNSSTTGGAPTNRIVGGVAQPGTAPTGARAISSAEPLYLAFVYDKWKTEIVSFDQADFFYADDIPQNILDSDFVPAATPAPPGLPSRDNSVNMISSNHFRLRVKERGAFGTTPANWPLWYYMSPRSGSFVWDATIAADWALRTISRFSQGATVLTVTTNLTQLAVEIGDFVQVDDRRHANQGDGFGESLSGALWEVTAKELRITEDTPCISWQLVFVRYGTAAGIETEITAIFATPKASLKGEPEVVLNNALEHVTAGDSDAIVAATGLGMFRKGDFD